MKRWGLILCAGAIGLAGPSLGAPANSLAAVEQAQAALRKGDAKAALKALDSALRKTKVPRQRAGIEYMRALALLMAKQRDAAIVAFKASQAGIPDDPTLVDGMFDVGVGFADTGIALMAIERLIDAFPDVARAMVPERVYQLFNQLHFQKKQTEAEELRIKLARVGFGGEHFDVRDSMSVGAIEAHLKRGNLDEASRLAATIIARDELERLLTHRRFQALWPAIELRAAGRMAQPLAEAVTVAENMLREKPDDVAARRTLVSAYADAERPADAEATARAFANTPEAIAGIDEAGGWLINHHASILHSLKRYPEAESRMASLRVLDIAKAPWLINMIINRVARLVREENYGAADKLLPEATTLAATYGNGYARQLLRAYDACSAFRGSARKAAAPELVAAMLAKRDDSPRVTASALICVDKRDEAAAIVIGLLTADDLDRRDDVIDALMPSAPRPGDAPNARAFALSSLLDRPDVRVAFDKVARTLPDRFRPLAVPLAQ